MKAHYYHLFFALILYFSGSVHAQSHIQSTPKSRTFRHHSREQSQTAVFMIGSEADTLAKDRALQYYQKYLRSDLQPDGMPRFIIADSKAKAVFAVGGFVNFRMAYDFNDAVNSLDFSPYDIPVYPEPGNAQHFLMDVSTSRLYFKTVIASPKGPIEGYLSADFRGSNTMLKLRAAYISYRGFTFGRYVSTFCDQAATFTTLDFRGPNSQPNMRNMLLRYEHEWKNGLKIALGVEYPNVNATYNTICRAVNQRVPDIPFYIQYEWNDNHIRFSGLLRNMLYRNLEENTNVDRLGWGAQFSSSFSVSPRVRLYAKLVFGQGLASYMADLGNSGLDMIPSATHAGDMIAPQTLAGQAGVQFNIMPKLPLTVGYSQVYLANRENSLEAVDYRIGRYLACNIFYHLSPFWQVGMEYLFGTRTNVNFDRGSSHRIQTAVQFNF